uniref:Uncharacterized protein n=1 Tax=Ditylenchus dipsaci TaxID=166011 RepID=A0A915CYX9_9BILA
MELMSTEDCMQWRTLLQQVKQSSDSKKEEWLSERSEIVTKAKEYMLQNPDSNNPMTSVAAQILYRLGEWEFNAIEDSKRLPLLAAFLNSADVNWDSFVGFFSTSIFVIDQLDPLKIQEVVSSLKANWTRLERSLNQVDLRRIVDRVLQLWHLGMHCEMSHSRRITRAIANGVVGLYSSFGRSIFKELLQVYVMQMPHFLKFKYFFLSHLLDNVHKSELSEPIMLECYKQLEQCLKCQHLASVTPNSVVSLGLRFLENGTLEDFVGLLKRTLTCSVKVVRINCCRHWLAKIYSDHKLSAEIFGQLNIDLLTHIQQFKAADDSDSSEPVWWMQETFLWAWVNTYKYCIRRKNILLREAEIDYLKVCLRSRQNSIKLIAVEILQQILYWDSSKLSCFQVHPEAHQFVLANFGTDDVDVRKCVLDLFVCLSQANKQSLMQHFLNWIKPKECVNIERVLTTLKIMLIDIHSATTQLVPYLLQWLSDEEEQSVRTTCLQIFSKLIEECYDQVEQEELCVQVQQLFRLQADSGLKLVSLNFFELLLKLGKDVDISSLDCDEAIRIEMASLRVKYGFQQKSALIADCLAVNQQLLQLGGSSSIGVCQPAYQLNHFMNTDLAAAAAPEMVAEADEDHAVLEWSEKPRNVLPKYGDGLIHSCCALLTHSINLDLCYITKCVDSVWQVMLRSHHRGVLEHCSGVFEGFVKLLAQKQHTKHLPLHILENTLELLGQNECQSRDIAFSKMLTCICSHFPAECNRVILGLINLYDKKQQDRHVKLRVLHVLQKFLLAAAFDLSAIHASICDFLLRTALPQTGNCFRLFAQLSCLFSGMPEKVPLACFLNTNCAVMQLIYDKLVQLRLERLVVVHFPFSSQQGYRYAKSLFGPLQALLLAEPALVIRRQILEVILNMVPCQKYEQVKILAEQLCGTEDAFTTDILYTIDRYILSGDSNTSSCEPTSLLLRKHPIKHKLQKCDEKNGSGEKFGQNSAMPDSLFQPSTTYTNALPNAQDCLKKASVLSSHGPLQHHCPVDQVFVNQHKTYCNLSASQLETKQKEVCQVSG